MKNGEVIFYLGLIIFLVIYIISAFSLGFGDFSAPGPGFLPIIVGITALFVSVILFVNTIIIHLKVKNVIENRESEKKETKKELVQAKLKFINSPFQKIIVFILILAGYIYLFDRVSFYINTFILMVLLFRLFGLKSWLKTLTGSGVFIIAVYIIFTRFFYIYF